MPLAKAQVPPSPKLEPILGLIPLKAGEQVFATANKRHFIVPKSGGVFWPKAAAVAQENNNDQWAYYSAGVDDSVRFYNARIQDWNDKLADMKLSAKKKSWWKIW
jgi:hypothetical protein